MENRLEIALLYVTSLISLGVFKDELSRIMLSMGYGTLTAANYLLYCVIGLSLCLYLYMIDIVFAETKFRKWKCWYYISKFAFYLFVTILLTPVVIILSYSIQHARLVMIALSTFFSFAALLIAIRVYLFIDSDRKSGRNGSARKSALNGSARASDRSGQPSAPVREPVIKELGNATRLLNDGYYSQSVLESFKVLEIHLYWQIRRRDVMVERHKTDELIAAALKEGVLYSSDLPSIQELQRMRHIAAHFDGDLTEIQAAFALNSLRQILLRNGNGTAERIYQ